MQLNKSFHNSLLMKSWTILLHSVVLPVPAWPQIQMWCGRVIATADRGLNNVWEVSLLSSGGVSTFSRASNVKLDKC